MIVQRERGKYRGQKGWEEKQDGVGSCREGGMERKCLVQSVCYTTFLFLSWSSIVNHQRLQGLGFLHPSTSNSISTFTHLHSSAAHWPGNYGCPISSLLSRIVTPMRLTRSCAQSNSDGEQPQEGCFFHTFILISDTQKLLQEGVVISF